MEEILSKLTELKVQMDQGTKPVDSTASKLAETVAQAAVDSSFKMSLDSINSFENANEQDKKTLQDVIEFIQKEEPVAQVVRLCMVNTITCFIRAMDDVVKKLKETDKKEEKSE